MFTGIINNLGKIARVSESRIEVSTDKDFTLKLSVGDSVALNGACFTVIDLTKNSFKVDVMPESRQRTNFGQAKTGDLINLELPVTPNTFLAGHIVQGHVDGVGTVKKISLDGNSRILTISHPKDLKKYIVPKGSVAINGISLTVIGTSNNHLTVGIIPYTWEHTMFHTLKVSDPLNLEVDILAKYICQKI